MVSSIMYVCICSFLFRSPPPHPSLLLLGIYLQTNSQALPLACFQGTQTKTGIMDGTVSPQIHTVKS